MITLKTRLIVILAIVSIASACDRMDKTEYNSIIKERDAILTELVNAQEIRLKNAVGSQEELMAARIALLTFRRDSADSKEEKMTQQAMIIDVYEKQVESLKLRASMGLATRFDIMAFKEYILREKQIYEELRLNIQRGKR